ncbi:MAG: hypothetical protein ACFFDT_22695 [Candidatus Hodarchaeota archaeon]
MNFATESIGILQRMLTEQEERGHVLCCEAALGSGYRWINAESCDDGEYLCAFCPFITINENPNKE